MPTLHSTPLAPDTFEGLTPDRVRPHAFPVQKHRGRRVSAYLFTGITRYGKDESATGTPPKPRGRHRTMRRMRSAAASATTIPDVFEIDVASNQQTIDPLTARVAGSPRRRRGTIRSTSLTKYT